MAYAFDTAESFIENALENPTEHPILETLQIIFSDPDNPLNTQFLTADVAACLEGLDSNDEEITAEEQEIISDCYRRLEDIVDGVHAKVDDGAAQPIQPIIADPLSEVVKARLRTDLPSWNTGDIEDLKRRFPIQALTIESVVREYKKTRNIEQALSVSPPFDLTPEGVAESKTAAASQSVALSPGRSLSCQMMGVHVGDGQATPGLNAHSTVSAKSDELRDKEAIYLVPSTNQPGEGTVTLTFDSVNWVTASDLLASDGNPQTFVRGSSVTIMPESLSGGIPPTPEDKLRWAREQGLISRDASELPAEIERYFPELHLTPTGAEAVPYSIQLPTDQSYLVFIQAGERNDPHHPRDPYDNFTVTSSSPDFHSYTMDQFQKLVYPRPECPSVEIQRALPAPPVEPEKEPSPVQFTLKGDYGLYFAEHYPYGAGMDAGFRFFVDQNKVWFLRPGFGVNMWGYDRGELAKALLFTPQLHVGGGFRLPDKDFVVMFDSAWWVIENKEFMLDSDGNVDSETTEYNLDLDLGVLATYKGIGVFTGYRLDKGFHVGLVLERALDIPVSERSR